MPISQYDLWIADLNPQIGTEENKAGLIMNERSNPVPVKKTVRML